MFECRLDRLVASEDLEGLPVGFGRVECGDQRSGDIRAGDFAPVELCGRSDLAGGRLVGQRTGPDDRVGEVARPEPLVGFLLDDQIISERVGTRFGFVGVHRAQHHEPTDAVCLGPLDHPYRTVVVDTFDILAARSRCEDDPIVVPDRVGDVFREVRDDRLGVVLRHVRCVGVGSDHRRRVVIAPIENRHDLLADLAVRARDEYVHDQLLIRRERW